MLLPYMKYGVVQSGEYLYYCANSRQLNTILEEICTMSEEVKKVSEEETKAMEHAEGAVEELFGSLCEFMQIEPQRNPDTFIATSIGAIEYACAIAKQCGVEYGAYMEAVNNVWGRVNGEDEGTVREQDETGLEDNSPAP